QIPVLEPGTEHEIASAQRSERPRGRPVEDRRAVGVLGLEVQRGICIAVCGVSAYDLGPPCKEPRLAKTAHATERTHSGEVIARSHRSGRAGLELLDTADLPAAQHL